MRIDNKKVNEKERPTDLTYERYIKLIQLFKLHKFNERLIFENSEFIVQDVLFNTLLLQSNKALIELAKILDYKNDINLLKYWVNKTENAINTFSVKSLHFEEHIDFELAKVKIYS